MKIGCPECGPITEMSREKMEDHNEDRHDGETVARRLDEFDGELLPELEKIPTQHRENWKQEFEDHYMSDSRERTAFDPVDESADPQVTNRCNFCGGALKSDKRGGTGGTVCTECGRHERDTHVSGT